MELKNEVQARKCLVFRIVDKTQDNLKHHPRSTRGSIWKKNYIPLPPARYLPYSANDIQKLGTWLKDEFGQGTFDIRFWMLYKHKVLKRLLKKLKSIAVIRIDVDGETYKVIPIDVSEISKFAFWRNKHRVAKNEENSVFDHYEFWMS